MKKERGAIQKEGNTRQEKVDHTREVLQSKRQDIGNPRRVEDKRW